jgi:hypothetical protein
MYRWVSYNTKCNKRSEDVNCDRHSTIGPKPSARWLTIYGVLITLSDASVSQHKHVNSTVPNLAHNMS